MVTEERKRYQREWVAKRRAEWFSENGPSKHCGSTEALEIHHLDPKQKESHSIFSWSKDRRDVELAKCIVLCHICHAMETRKQIWIRRPIQHIHGTQTEYRRGCRCDACTLAKYEAIKIERKKKKTAKIP